MKRYTNDELLELERHPERARNYYLERAAWMQRTADAKRVDAMKFAIEGNYAEGERVSKDADHMERTAAAIEDQIDSLVASAIKMAQRTQP